jgi:hypothetical protein
MVEPQPLLLPFLKNKEKSANYSVYRIAPKRDKFYPITKIRPGIVVIGFRFNTLAILTEFIIKALLLPSLRLCYTLINPINSVAIWKT